MTRPRRPPVKPGPILDDPTQGQYQVVVTFRVNGPFTQPWTWDEFWFAVRRWGEEFAHGVVRESESHHVRVIGAGGERSEQEIWPARTEDLAPVRGIENLDTGGRT